MGSRDHIPYRQYYIIIFDFRANGKPALRKKRADKHLPANRVTIKVAKMHLSPKIGTILVLEVKLATAPERVTFAVTRKNHVAVVIGAEGHLVYTVVDGEVERDTKTKETWRKEVVVGLIFKEIETVGVDLEEILHVVGVDEVGAVAELAEGIRREVTEVTILTTNLLIHGTIQTLGIIVQPSLQIILWVSTTVLLCVIVLICSSIKRS